MNRLSGLKVLVIGDTILDQYVFVIPKGRAIKDPILSVRYIRDEMYAGGILAGANHVSSFVDSVTLVTLVGDTNSKLEFIKGSLGANINLKTFAKKGSNTIVKKRFVDALRNSKLFKIEYIEDLQLSADVEQEVVEYLHEEVPKYDVVIVGDFGHGFITDRIRRVLEEKSRFLAVNAQSNSSNMGYNYFTLYKKMDFFTGNEEEFRLPVSMRFEDIREVIDKVRSTCGFKKFLLTRSKHGSIFVADDEIFEGKGFITRVTDAVGAGDAVFAITSLVTYTGADNNLVAFLSNCVGGIAVSTQGNKDSVTKEKLLDFVNKVYEIKPE
ncbi:PfkB family carbohydrate kinase [Nanoarchaeota archaeon]